jgi:hypothetical protein
LIRWRPAAAGSGPALSATPKAINAAKNSGPGESATRSHQIEQHGGDGRQLLAASGGAPVPPQRAGDDRRSRQHERQVMDLGMRRHQRNRQQIQRHRSKRFAAQPPAVDGDDPPEHDGGAARLEHRRQRRARNPRDRPREAEVERLDAREVHHLQNARELLVDVHDS